MQPWMRLLRHAVPQVVKLFPRYSDIFALSREIFVFLLSQKCIKIRVIFGVRFERRKVDKKQSYMKTETCKLYSFEFEYFCRMS